MKDFILTYSIDDRLYLNITNRCTNNCSFCIRKTQKGVGYNLWLDKEPTKEQMIDSLDRLDRYSEVIFCGYGEPLIRIDLAKELAGYIKSEYGSIIRINTNGHADLIHGPGSIERLRGLVDRINISLNAHNAEKYVELCSPTFGLKTYQGIIQFTESCIGVVPDITLSVVDWPGVDLDKCSDIARSLGVKFRIRKHDGG